jgi:multidrug efflux pump subunit AcrA (membrane-fusion protein)
MSRADYLIVARTVPVSTASPLLTRIASIAPSAGTIDAILVNKGDAVVTGTVLATIKY